MGNLASLHFGLGQLKKAERLFYQALALARDRGHLRAQGYVLGNLAELYLRQQRAGAEEHLLAAAEIHARAGNLEQEGWNCLRLAGLLEDRGDHAAAEPHLHRALRALSGTGKHQWLAAAFARLYRLCLASDRKAEASQALASFNHNLRNLRDDERVKLLDVVRRAQVAAQREPGALVPRTASR
jgi:tetratricopeptide (TPR) repeat protein